MSIDHPSDRRFSGKKVAISAFFILLAIALFTYFIVPKFVIPYFAVKPKQTQELFAQLSAALLTYRADHGAFPPEDDLTRYRHMTKNLAKSHAVGMSTYRASVLTTPTAYINAEKIFDPYAVPDQYAPPAYIRGFFADDGGEFAILVTAGPNLTYEIRPPDVRTLRNKDDLMALLTKHRYDATNGTRSRGDFYHALIAHADSTVDSFDGTGLH